MSQSHHLPVPSRPLNLCAHDLTCIMVLASENDFAKAQKGPLTSLCDLLPLFLWFVCHHKVSCLDRSIDGCGCGMWLAVIDNASACVCMTSKIIMVCGLF